MKAFKPLLIGILLVSMTGCEEVIDALANKTVLLTQRAWVFESMSGYDDVTNDFFSALLTGATWDFKDDGTYTTGGPLGGDSGTWTFFDGENQIIIDPPGGDTWTILKLTADQLHITVFDADAIDEIATLKLRH